MQIVYLNVYIVLLLEDLGKHVKHFDFAIGKKNNITFGPNIFSIQNIYSKWLEELRDRAKTTKMKVIKIL